MLFPFSPLLAFLVFAKGVVSATSNFSLYAYGDNLLTGVRLFYADGHAYLGHQASMSTAEAVNITLTLTDDLKFVASPEGNTSWSKQPIMYIGADADDLKIVSFASEDELPEGAISKGFGIFGGWAYNSQNAGTIEMNFVAAPVKETGLYKIRWNAAGNKMAGEYVPISLRTEAPASPEN